MKGKVTMAPKNTLAWRIATRREELGLSQTDLAHAVGVTLPAVMQWEDGTVKSLKSQTLMALAVALNVTPQWLMSGDGEKQATQDRQAFSAALAQRDRAKSPRARLAWERIAASFAKAALTPALLLGVALSPLWTPNARAEIAIQHNASPGAFVRQVFDLTTDWMRRRLRVRTFGAWLGNIARRKRCLTFLWIPG